MHYSPIVSVEVEPNLAKKILVKDISQLVKEAIKFFKGMNGIVLGKHNGHQDW